MKPRPTITPTGQRTTVETATAAAALGKTPPQFRAWAHRRGLKPVRTIRLGRSTIALYDLQQVYETDRHAPNSAVVDQPPDQAVR